MSIPSLQELSACVLSSKFALRLPGPEKSVVTRVLLEMVLKCDQLYHLKDDLVANGGHVCQLQTYSVWHGSSLGPRRFRKSILCHCSCLGRPAKCSCECGSLIKMLFEFREAEPFIGYGTRRRHKLAKRYINKRTSLGRLLSGPIGESIPNSKRL